MQKTVLVSGSGRRITTLSNILLSQNIDSENLIKIDCNSDENALNNAHELLINISNKN